MKTLKINLPNNKEEIVYRQSERKNPQDTHVEDIVYKDGIYSVFFGEDWYVAYPAQYCIFEDLHCTTKTSATTKFNLTGQPSIVKGFGGFGGRGG